MRLYTHLCGCFARLMQDELREDSRQLVLADDDLDVHPEGVRLAQHFHYSAASRACLRRPFGDFGIDNQAFEALVACRGSALTENPMSRSAGYRLRQRLAAWDHDRLRQFFGEREHLMTLLPV